MVLTARIFLFIKEPSVASRLMLRETALTIAFSVASLFETSRAVREGTEGLV